MKRSISLCVLLLFIALGNIGGCNVYGDLADKTSDAAISEDVQKFIDKSMWFDALGKWQTLSSSGQALRTNKVLLATIYAGYGGLDLLSLSQTISSNPSSTTFFKMLFLAFRGKKVTDFNFQVLAEQTMQSISPTASGRTTDENIFLLFVELAKLGTLMAGTADPTGTGVVGATYDNCAISTNQGAHVVTAIGNILDILAVTSTSLAGVGIGPIQTACTTGPLAGSCNITDVANVTAPMNSVGKTLIGESNLGVGLAAPLNDPYCQLSLSPIDPTTATPPNSCPGGVGVGIVCP